MPNAATPETVMAAYAERINQHDFSLLALLIAENAVFWFSSGSYVGLDQARRAFERTWQRLQNETYWLESLTWIVKGDQAASYTYHGCRKPLVNCLLSSGTLSLAASRFSMSVNQETHGSTINGRYSPSS